MVLSMDLSVLFRYLCEQAVITVQIVGKPGCNNLIENKGVNGGGRVNVDWLPFVSMRSLSLGAIGWLHVGLIAVLD